MGGSKFGAMTAGRDAAGAKAMQSFFLTFTSSFVSSLADAFNSLSDTVQGVVIASVFSFVSGCVALFVTWKLNNRRADFEREQSASTRTFELRREALMHAAEGVIEAIGSLTLLSNETLSETDIAKKFQDGTSKALRAYVVANKETVEILTGLVKETGHRFFELLPRRIQLIEAYTDHSIPLDQARKAMEKADQLTAQQRAAVIAGVTEREMESLKGFIEFQLQQHEKWSQEADEAFPKFLAYRSQYAYDCLLAHIELQGKANRLISSLRQDVGVDKPGDWSYVEYARLDVDDIKQAYRDGMKRIDVEVQ